MLKQLFEGNPLTVLFWILAVMGSAFGCVAAFVPDTAAAISSSLNPLAFQLSAQCGLVFFVTMLTTYAVGDWLFVRPYDNRQPSLDSAALRLVS